MVAKTSLSFLLEGVRSGNVLSNASCDSKKSTSPMKVVVCGVVDDTRRPLKEFGVGGGEVGEPVVAVLGAGVVERMTKCCSFSLVSAVKTS